MIRLLKNNTGSKIGSVLKRHNKSGTYIVVFVNVENIELIDVSHEVFNQLLYFFVRGEKALFFSFLKNNFWDKISLFPISGTYLYLVCYDKGLNYTSFINFNSYKESLYLVKLSSL